MTAITPKSTDGTAPGARGALVLGGLAAILASSCCLGPLVLLMLGVSGAWIGNLTALEPFRPVFVAAAVVALALAYRRIFRPVAVCRPGDVCAIPRVQTTYKVLFAVVAFLLLVAVALPYIAPWFY